MPRKELMMKLQADGIDFAEFTNAAKTGTGAHGNDHLRLGSQFFHDARLWFPSVRVKGTGTLGTLTDEPLNQEEIKRTVSSAQVA